jgi:hypothetical protein
MKYRHLPRHHRNMPLNIRQALPMAVGMHE